VTPKRNELHDRACRVDGYLAVLQNQHIHLVRSFKELEIKFYGLLSAEYVTELVKYVLCFLLTTIGHERVRVMDKGNQPQFPLADASGHLPKSLLCHLQPNQTQTGMPTAFLWELVTSVKVQSEKDC
jgi:hypothetical protein